MEYDRLEEELEQLNSQMDQLREETQNKAIRRQQLDGETKVLREQILSGVQSEEHYKSRLQSIEADLKETPGVSGEAGGGEIPAPCSSSGSKEAPGGRRGPDFQYSGTDRRVLPGSGEWQERDYRASRIPVPLPKEKPSVSIP